MLNCYRVLVIKKSLKGAQRVGTTYFTDEKPFITQGRFLKIATHDKNTMGIEKYEMLINVDEIHSVKIERD